VLVPIALLLQIAVAPSGLAPAEVAPAAPPLPRAVPGVALTRVNTAEPVVALTFDACATKRQSNGFDREIFDILRREQVPATVFVSGRWVETHPAEAQELAAEPLIELGNHSWDHPAFSQLSRRHARAEIADTERAIAGLGRKSVGFRPPFGDWDRWLLSETGALPVVLWDVVSGDAGGHVPAPGIVDVVTRTARPGSIVIFHINGRGPHTKTALPEIIRLLRARGLRFVRVSELLALPNAEIVRARPQRYHKRIAGGRAQPRGG
jgi:peptidoglycan/xylan/chitin deacetylase (PgdA/CDA1 family)